MSVRQKSDGRWVVEMYDPVRRAKRQLPNRDIRELGFEPPITERQARRVERAALNARDQRRPGSNEETCDSFAARWARDYQGARGDSTTEHNHERVQVFGAEHAGLTLRSITRLAARRWAKANSSRLPAVRAMFSDAVEDGLADANPFAKLGHKQTKGRRDIAVLTEAEVHDVARLAHHVHGASYGPEFEAMILWQAYTCMRPGETFAARFSRLSGDTYDVGAQWNSRLRRETEPKHGSTGLVFVPEPARGAVLAKPRRLGDDMIFRTKRGKPFRQTSLHEYWHPVRCAFGRPELDFYELRHFGASYMLNQLELEPWVIALQLRHTDGGILVVQLYGHPSRRKALEQIRRAYGENVGALSAGRVDSSARHSREGRG